jgi:hypothetical protein
MEQKDYIKDIEFKSLLLFRNLTEESRPLEVPSSEVNSFFQEVDEVFKVRT